MHSRTHCAAHGALIVVRGDLRAVAVTGPDRFSWLMGMLTCDLSPVEQNQSVYGLVLDKQGKILADLIALQCREQILLAVDGDGAGDLAQHLDHFLIMEDADIEPLSSPHGFLLLIGPRASEAADAARSHPGIGAVRPGRLLGTDAAIVMVDDQDPHDLAAAIAASDEAFASATTKQFEALRIELGIPKFGIDFGPSSYPMDAGLDDHAISFSKGCYVGQEVVVKLRSRGKPVRVLRRLQLDPGALIPEPGASVTLPDGKEAGQVTSANQREGGEPVAYALMRRADADAADHVIVGGHEARVLPAWGPLS